MKLLMFQVSLIGPMLGQLNHFYLILSEAGGYASGHYRDQATRVYRNVEERLSISPFIGGDRYSIADIAGYPWMSILVRHGLNEANFPHLVAWRGALDERPTVRRGVAIYDDVAASLRATKVNASTLERLFARSASGPDVDLVAYAPKGPMTIVKTNATDTE